MEMKVRIRGIDQSIRWMAAYDDHNKEAVRSGIIKAAEYLKTVIQEKFGKYQATGGPNGGAWPRLKIDTIFKKMKRYGIKDKPLIASGDMRDSFYVRLSPSKKVLAGYVASEDPKLIYHVYGAPRAGVPKRDPFLITAIEEKDMCHDIIREELYRSIDRRL